MSEQQRRQEAAKYLAEYAVRLAGCYYLQLDWYPGHWHGVAAITENGFMLAPCEGCMPMPADVEARFMVAHGL